MRTPMAQASAKLSILAAVLVSALGAGVAGVQLRFDRSGSGGGQHGNERRHHPHAEG